MIGTLWQWLTDPAHWSGSDGILRRLSEHLGYSVITVVLACLIAIPLGLWIGHSGRGRWLISAANSLRAVPTLGLLFALIMWAGPLFGGSDAAFYVPSIAVLVLLAIPPILTGAYAGLEAVDPEARDAANGVGMKPREVLWQVEVPCSLPLLLSGIQAATLQVIATATIAAYVGLGGLGRFLIDGLATSDYAQTAGGAVLAGLLAVTVDVSLGAITKRLISPGLRPQVGIRSEDGIRVATTELVTEGRA